MEAKVQDHRHDPVEGRRPVGEGFLAMARARHEETRKRQTWVVGVLPRPEACRGSV